MFQTLKAIVAEAHAAGMARMEAAQAEREHLEARRVMTGAQRKAAHLANPRKSTKA